MSVQRILKYAFVYYVILLLPSHQVSSKLSELFAGSQNLYLCRHLIFHHESKLHDLFILQILLEVSRMKRTDNLPVMISPSVTHPRLTVSALLLRSFPLPLSLSASCCFSASLLTHFWPSSPLLLRQPLTAPRRGGDGSCHLGDTRQEWSLMKWEKAWKWFTGEMENDSIAFADLNRFPHSSSLQFKVTACNRWLLIYFSNYGITSSFIASCLALLLIVFYCGSLWIRRQKSVKLSAICMQVKKRPANCCELLRIAANRCELEMFIRLNGGYQHSSWFCSFICSETWHKVYICMWKRVWKRSHASLTTPKALPVDIA